MWPHRSLWRATWLFLGFQQPMVPMVTLPRKSTSIPLPAHGCCLLWLLWLLVDQTSDLSEVPLEQALLLLHGIPILARNAPKPKAEEVLLKPSLRRESRRSRLRVGAERHHPDRQQPDPPRPPNSSPKERSFARSSAPPSRLPSCELSSGPRWPRCAHAKSHWSHLYGFSVVCIARDAVDLITEGGNCTASGRQVMG